MNNKHITNENKLLKFNFPLDVSELEDGISNIDRENFRSLKIIINQIGEAAFEYETFYDYIKKVYRIMFYTKFILLIIIFYLLFHGYIGFIGKNFVLL